MIASNKECRGFMAAVAVLIVLITLLLFFAWSRKRNNLKPEPPLHAAALGSKNSCATGWFSLAYCMNLIPAELSES
jgi:hypothetical protein